jgi:hypothetical protein
MAFRVARKPQGCATPGDLLNDNEDLIEAAAGLMRGRMARRLEADVEPTAEGVTIQVRSANLDRVDAYINERPVGSQDVRGDRCVFHAPQVMGRNPELRLEGFEEGGLAAVRLAAMPDPQGVRRGGA